AVDQALLRLLQPREVVVATGCEAGELDDALADVCVIALGAFDLDGAQTPARAGVELDVEAGLRCGAIDVGQAGGDARARVAQRTEAAQRGALGAVPAILRERLADKGLCLGHDVLALTAGVRVLRHRALERDLHRGDLRLLARLHRQGDAPQR